ncbi:MAG: TPM domain-containing protein [Alphaproteobacteria bacterium]
MKPFSSDEHAVIADAISRAERTTSGEIVVVVARASSGYFFFALMCVALAALAVPLPLIHFTKWPIEYVYLLQLAVFGLGVLIARWERFRVAIAPRGLKQARAHLRAVEQFLAQNLHTTKGRTGVLIYVSDAERYAEVIADDGIYKKVSPEIWDELIEDLTAQIGRGNRVEGFVAAIETCGAILAEHFPPQPLGEDELPNHLIVIDGAKLP